MPDHGEAGQPQFALVKACSRILSDGSLLIESGRDVEGVCMPLGQRLQMWADLDPERIFLTENRGGRWESVTYSDAWRKSGQVACNLLRCGLSAETPLLIVAGNSIEHALVAIGAMRVGIPVAPVSVAYASHGSFERLELVSKVAGATAAFLGPELSEGVAGVCSGWGLKVFGPGELFAGEMDQMLVSTAESGVSNGTVAKLMFTSGSTGAPKAVVNTHGMMVSNQLQLAMVWPRIQVERPVLVDWLPWSHTFGGNFVFNMALWHGGALIIDGGRPTPALIGRTLEAMAEFGPTRYFSVPAGFEMLMPELVRNPELAKKAFRNVEFVFCAAAALPEGSRNRFAELLSVYGGREIPFLGGWGSTETAPCATAVHFPNEHAANIGVPLPGVLIKLVPDAGKFELRVKGPNVTPGYWRAPEATAKAFDPEGFYCIGDAGKLIDPARPEVGIAFDGRVAENFKLKSGTWVNVGALRLALIDAARPLIQDAVLTGHDRDEIGALVFLSEPECVREFGPQDAVMMSQDIRLAEKLRSSLQALNAKGGGSSTRIGRFRIESTPPSLATGEITDKGYINQRAVLTERVSSVIALYESEGGVVV